MQSTRVAEPSVIFAELADAGVSELVTRRARSLAERYAGSRVRELERAVELAEQLLVAGQAAWAEEVAAVVAREEFTGDFEKWTWIQTAAVIRFAIARRMADPEAEQVTAATRERFRSVLAPDGSDVMASVRRSVLTERLSASGLWTSLREKATVEAPATGDAALLQLARIRYWEELLFVVIMGGSESFPASDAQALAREQERVLLA